MSRIYATTGLMQALIDECRSLIAPLESMDARLAIARKVSEQALVNEDLLSTIVVGSTALQRFSVRSDLDIVLVERSLASSVRFERRYLCEVHVEIERITRQEALAATSDDGWIWELRNTARLGCGVSVFDPEGFASELARRAAAMAPWVDRVEDTLKGIYLTLGYIGRGYGSEFAQAEALRGCFDNLAVLVLLDTPRRYQKAKWTLADLLHAEKAHLALAMLWVYGVYSRSEASSRDVLLQAREFVDAVHAECNAPSHDQLLGDAPTFLEASYVSRCLADAGELAELGCQLEAQYVAKFAVRLAAGQLAARIAPNSLIEALSLSNGGLKERYLELFPITSTTAKDALSIALKNAEVLRQTFLPSN